MINLTNGDTVANSVLKTKNYDKFSFINTNRSINKLHLRNLRASMSRKYLVSPILVNEKLQILDGQHRFLAVQELEFDLYYIVLQNTSNKDIQTYNALNSRWTLKDYIESYADDGIESYKQIVELKEQYPILTYETAIYLTINTRAVCGNLNQSQSAGTVQDGSIHTIKSGELIITDYMLNNAINKIEFFLKIYNISDNTRVKSRSFLLALMKVYENPEVDNEYLISKLTQYHWKFSKRTNMSDYLEVLEGIYNYNKKTNKVYFRKI